MEDPAQVLDSDCGEVRLHIESEFPLPVATLALGLEASPKARLTVLPPLNMPPATATERPRADDSFRQRFADRPCYGGDALMESRRRHDVETCELSMCLASRLGISECPGAAKHPTFLMSPAQDLGEQLRTEQTVTTLKRIGNVGIRPPVGRRMKTRSHGVVPQKGETDHTAEVTPASWTALGAIEQGFRPWFGSTG
jgi:hypothetical protein